MLGAPAPLRMVFSGEFWRGSSGLGLAQGFRRLGWAVQEVDLSRLFPDLGATVMARGLRKALGAVRGEVYEAAVRQAVETTTPSVFVSIKGTRVTRELLEWLAHRNILTAMYYPDFHFNHPGLSLDSFDAYDLIITSKSFHVDFLKSRFGAEKVHYVPHGYSDEVHWPVLGAPADDELHVDLQHIGAHSSYKQVWLEHLRAELPQASLRLSGARWARPAATGPLAGARVSDSIYDVAYSGALQSARINIAVMMGPHVSGWQDFVSTRTFEIAACRGFMLHEDNDEVREFFEPGVEIELFSSEAELADKARFFLSRPDLRQGLIERAYARAVPAYGYASRAAMIAGLLGGRR